MATNSTLSFKKSTNTNNILKPHQNPLQILLQIGFPKHRADKALAATGNQSAEIATAWLLSHVNDPFLDDNSPREYILYVCPKSPLSEQLKEFWDKSLYYHGWNGAHNFTPHITLVSFFKTPDEDVPFLIKGLESVMERDGAILNEPLKLETYKSRNFMGFFVAEEHADYLKRIAMQYVKEVSNAIINDTYEHFDALTACFPWCTTTTARCIPRGSRSNHEPYAKSLHMTLAYQFPNDQFNGLKNLVDELDPSNSGEWELRLYSRDTRINGKQVHKVIREYIPTESDDLELKIDDYLYVSSEAVNTSTADGWLEGTSYSTGCSGYFLESYTCRVSESDAWTLHKSIPLNKCEKLEDMEDDAHVVLTKTQIKDFHRDRMIASLQDVVTTTKLSRVPDPNKRNIFVLRHAERVDFVFGKWVPHCFDEAGNYLRKDLNLPPSLPQRKTGPEGYSKDGPITCVGTFYAKSIGEVFKSNNVNIDYVYCSPSLRCIQTVDSFLQGIGKKNDIKIRVEPCVFEWTLWYPIVPEWMSLEELVAAGYNIDTEYKSFKNRSDIKAKESIENFYSRSADLAKKILQDHPSGNILIVGHSATLDTITRQQVQGKGARSKDELFGLISKIAYCSLVQITEEGDKWQFVDPPCPPMTYCVNHRFDWKVLL